MDESEVLWQVLMAAIRDAQVSGADAGQRAIEAANAFKAGLAAFRAVATEVSE